MPPGEVLVRLTKVVKHYRALRPLRVADLRLRAGHSVALLGFDQAMAEVLVDLVTGAILPDEGEIVTFGRSTAAIENPEAWLETLDGFGLLTDRAVLVESFTVEQNLAMPISVRVQEIPDELRTRVARLADEVGLDPACLTRPAGDLSPLDRARLRLGRALALDPAVLLAEHPTASLDAGDAARLATDLSRVSQERALATAVVTADRGFARSVASDLLVLEPSTGTLAPTLWRRLFS